MKRVLATFGRRYGDGPIHLLGLLGCFAFAGYVVSRVVTVPHHWQIGLYFVVALVANDLVIYPLFTLGDRLLRAGRRPAPAPAGDGRRVPWVNHVRVPVVLSAVLLMVSFPVVLRLAPDTYRAATGLAPTPFLGRWLVITGALFAASALAYGARVALAARAGRAGSAAGRRG
ncbi:MAG TPA: hypothetical protein VFP61_14935 [Acidimicrobiales bacterium]|nr:hypothetical protein [Acidimicrobiales bacterium]